MIQLYNDALLSNNNANSVHFHYFMYRSNRIETIFAGFSQTANAEAEQEAIRSKR